MPFELGCPAPSKEGRPTILQVKFGMAPAPIKGQRRIRDTMPDASQPRSVQSTQQSFKWTRVSG